VCWAIHLDDPVLCIVGQNKKYFGCLNFATTAKAVARKRSAKARKHPYLVSPLPCEQTIHAPT
jgi:hypothetical protein